jgi:hypothetical protein
VGKTAKRKLPQKTKAKTDERRPDGLRVGSAAAKLVDAICGSKDGKTHAELVTMLGWPGGQCLPYLQRSCEKAGVRLKKQRKPGEPMRYYGIARKSR